MILLKTLFLFTLSINPTPADLTTGERLTLAACGACHLGDDGQLSGKLMRDVPKSLGTIYSSNITSDDQFGIGSWSRESLDKFLRTGTKPNGDKANIMMPRYSRMSDQDLDDIIAFLQSGTSVAAPSQEKTHASKLKMPARMAPVVKKINVDYPKSPISKPDTSNNVAYGRYLVNDVLHCYSCHSASPKGVNFNHPEQSKGYLGGGSRFPGLDGATVTSLNLTLDKQTGMGNYSQQDFIRTMKTWQRKNGQFLRFPMPSYPMLTDNDLISIYKYLETVPKINNKKLK